MADTKPQRRRLTTQKQLTQRPVTAPKSSKYYTTKAPDLNSTTYAAPSHYTDALKYYSAPSTSTTKATEDDYACCPILRGSYTEAPNCYTEVPADYYTEASKYYSAPIYTTITEAAKYYAVPTYCREAALSYYVEQEYYTDAPVHYTTTYATPQPPTTTYAAEFTTPSSQLSLMAGSTAGVAMSPWYGGNQTATPPPSYSTYATTSSCTDVFKYYTTKAPDLNSTTHAAPSHYTDAPNCYTEAPADVSTKTVEYYTEATKYYSAPIDITTTQAAKYYAVPTCYTKAALSCCVEQRYYTDAPVYYTTTYT
ncbi:hypothetical protein DAPPUDRAFT_96608 [Daphnia pulex]|uniref:Uncharacterized protein n=1 Tax=Daphnia pulex TaxID=6669 RepID=E9FYD2_DAPPU|nr:hypothetical protein DAPPUDRAFT_96608 [Daphnia pulex]|eukprot:EFX87792.1 hypothetical protein DAPPUDRAFT_96608 [Daphnia pulex]